MAVVLGKDYVVGEDPVFGRSSLLTKMSDKSDMIDMFTASTYKPSFSGKEVINELIIIIIVIIIVIIIIVKEILIVEVIVRRIGIAIIMLVVNQDQPQDAAGRVHRRDR